MRVDPERYLVAGGSGCGKSTFVKQNFASKPRVIVIDPKEDYINERGYLKINAGNAGWQVNLLSAVKAGWHTGFRIAVIVGRGADKKSVFNTLCGLVMDIQTPYHRRKWNEWITFVWEECSLLWQGGNVSPKEFNHAEELARLGRAYGIELVAVTQTPNRVNKDIRDNASVKVMFKIGDAESYKSIAAMLPRDQQSALDSLQKYEYLQINADSSVQNGKTSK